MAEEKAEIKAIACRVTGWSRGHLDNKVLAWEHLSAPASDSFSAPCSSDSMFQNLVEDLQTSIP